MRQVHRAGEKLFVDYSGQKPHLVDPEDRRGRRGRAVRRRARRLELHLRRGDGRRSRCPTGSRATSRASTSSAASRRPSSPISSRAASSCPCRYEPGSSAPTRSSPSTTARRSCRRGRRSRATRRRSRSAVQIAQRWILARLRNETFFSLAALNERIARAARGAQRRGRCAATARAAASSSSGSTGPALRPLPAEPLRVRRVEGRPRQHRLPRRGRPPLLLGPLRPAATKVDGRADQRDDRRDLPPGPAGRRARARCTPGRHTTIPEHMPKAHQRTSSGRPRASSSWAETHRPADRGARRRDPRRAAASRAGLPLVPGHPAARPSVRRRAARGRLRPRPRRRRPLLPPRRLDPEARPRPPAPARAARAPPPAPVHENVRGRDYYH